MFIPLIVVNCIVLGRAEAFASKNTVLASALDGLFQGIGYTVALVIMCVIRELLGSGTFGMILLAVIMILLLSASMSTLSSLVLTSSSTLTLDFIKGTLVKKMSEKKQLLEKRRNRLPFWSFLRCCASG
mgnify:CR=1 FL=1